MRQLLNFLFILLPSILVHLSAQNYALAIHGGAGFLNRSDISEYQVQVYRESLSSVLAIGDSMLNAGSSALDVVETVIRLMENDSIYNAGKGSVLNKHGMVECDASFMDGRNLEAGAVTGVAHIKNPITAARLVMEKSPHVMLAGKGAEEFALLHNVPFVPNKYFITARKHQAYVKKLGNRKHGTVGAVALDISGNIAAGTSTGGMNGKAFGRIGDSPIIGAGTYANNNTCGVSCTGHGEYYIRNVVAHDVSAMLAYTSKDLQEVTAEIIHEKLNSRAGAGGLIAVDKAGNISMEFNTTSMFRASSKNGKVYVAIFADE